MDKVGAGTSLRIIADLDNYFEGQPPKRLVRPQEMIIGGLEGGMDTGRPSVTIMSVLDDGTVVFGETSLRLFLMAADVLKAKFGDPRVEPTGAPA